MLLFQMAYISHTKINPPTLTPAKKSLCNAQQSCSPSPDETKTSVHTTKLLTTTEEGGVQTAKRPKSLPIVENLYTDTTKCKIDKLSSSVSSLHLQPQTVMSGYLERRASLEEWSKYVSIYPSVYLSTLYELQMECQSFILLLVSNIQGVFVMPGPLSLSVFVDHITPKSN